eukprot:CAMPEP_0201501166 /NCGR_PEP_ID=MMETSP0151_2-20130828/83443_1 /ASSEMBLY_ACC=CAM_ASM_000257 /TAXON_ID=200890 /ORGANISM="Paramoeba atlantica, Strain 621/1 / CCAP 1560/9" /LENGTH=466 /DNA_ID=CAMNT_0047894649 /DNA_START=325 /DNA_END=1726 /DNA_ORIENTATION=-
MELPEDLKEAVLIFYLVLRALDSIEDDMSVPLEKKIPQLRAFFSRLDQPGYRLSGVGEKDTERELLEHFDRVIEFYGKLDKKYRTVIQDICRRMGAGMADFTQKKVESIRDYELYCHYVAGLVGIGLTQLFAHSQYEDESLLNKEFEKTANSMGLFLQKTNITRDYQEDITQVPSRIFYPKEIWELYTPKFENFLNLNIELNLLEHYDRGIEFYGKLDKNYQAVIQDICRRMGAGMADFTQKKVESIRDYELYCHYVAGLVGIGLTQLFAHSQYEDESLLNKEFEKTANSMGLFLQKTNITRDYQEDITQQPPRIFYPKEIWEQYTPKFENFLDSSSGEKRLQCLNHMVVDALKHVPDCLDYMRQLENQQIFNFCAIPQVMAIATLSLCFNNEKVFQKVVKIRKGEAVKLMRQATTFQSVAGIFKRYLHDISKRAASAPMTDEVRENMERTIKGVVNRCDKILAVK